MKILGYIGTFNEGIDRPLRGLLGQTYPVDEILVVDNASTHTLPSGSFPEGVTVVRNSENLGVSGAITRGLEYARDHGFEWMWIFDADSAPRPDALDQLVVLYRSFDPAVQCEVGIMSCSQILVPSAKVLLGRDLTPSGPRPARIVSDRPYYECDATIWSGSLIRLEAVRRAGMPRKGRAGYWDDLGQDYGDIELSYRIRKAGYRVLIHRFSLVDQNVGYSRQIDIFGLSLLSTNHPPARRYLYFRNLVYFWVYLYPHKNWLGWSIWFWYRLSVTILKIILAEEDAGQKISACVAGCVDGIRKRLSCSYGVATRVGRR